ncbi:MAG: hypothetical protein R2751_17625 [Bacteroidales bacterium]
MAAGEHHRLSLFAGRRRGGWISGEGTVYRELDFQGISCRLLTTF